jgi:hypothetical protein
VEKGAKMGQKGLANAGEEDEYLESSYRTSALVAGWNFNGQTRSLHLEIGAL